MNEPMGVRIAQGLNVSLIGMTITIATLVVLALVIVVLSKAVAAFSKPKSNGTGGGADVSQTGAPTVTENEPTVSAAEVSVAGAGAAGGELVAIFAAVIAAMNEGKAFRILSYRKTGQTAPAWNLRGRNDYLSAKL